MTRSGDAIERAERQAGRRQEDSHSAVQEFESLKKAGETDAAGTKQKIKALGECHVLFICSSENKNIKEIIESVKNSGVLTVGDFGRISRCRRYCQFRDG